MRQPCCVSHNTGECELMVLPSVMLLPHSPLLKRVSEAQQGRIFLPAIFASQGIV